MSFSFQIQLLGTNSALPLYGRNTSSQYLQFGKHHFLIDCGEGTQHQLQRYQVKRNLISHIFISHLHGDHVYGLPGLLGSYAHFSRSSSLTIYGPSPIKKMLSTIFEASESRFSFPIYIIELDHKKAVHLNIYQTTQITAFPLKHRIPTIGYRFDYVPQERNIKKEVIKQYELTIEQIKRIKAGEDLIIREGKVIKNKDLTFSKYGAKSYAYCSDTVYDEDIIPYITNVNLLYHETTYLSDLEKEAKERMHSTLGQAIKISQKAQAKKLITGHYSSRYYNLEEFEAVAEKSSQDVSIGSDGNIYNF